MTDRPTSELVERLRAWAMIIADQTEASITKLNLLVEGLRQQRDAAVEALKDAKKGQVG